MGILKPIWIAPIIVLLGLVLFGISGPKQGVIPTELQDVNSPTLLPEQSVGSSSVTQIQKQGGGQESSTNTLGLRLCNGKSWASCITGRFVCPQNGDAYCEMETVKSPTAVKSSSSSSVLPVSDFRVLSPRAFVKLSCEQKDGRFRSGTGVIVSREGHILTAKHIVQDNTVDSIIVNKCLVYKFGIFDQASSEFAVYEASTVQVGRHRCLSEKCTPESGYDAGDFALLKINSLAPRLYGGKQGCIETYLGSPNIEDICAPYDSELPIDYEYAHVGQTQPRTAEHVVGVGIPLVLRDHHVLKRSEGTIDLVADDYISAELYITGGYSGGALLNNNNEMIGLLVSNSETFSTGTTLYAKFPTAYAIPSALFSTELGLSGLTKTGQ